MGWRSERLPYNIRKTEFSEAHFHIIVHVIMSLLGFEPVSEKGISDGRIDLTVRLSGIVYIFEFKYTDEDNSCAETALQHEIVCVGVGMWN